MRNESGNRPLQARPLAALQSLAPLVLSAQSIATNISPGQTPVSAAGDGATTFTDGGKFISLPKLAEKKIRELKKSEFAHLAALRLQ